MNPKHLTHQEIFNKELDQGTSTHQCQCIRSETRLLRLKQIIPAIIPISKSAWWAGVQSGRYPKPFKLSERTTVWKSEDIMKVIEEAGR